MEDKNDYIDPWRLVMINQDCMVCEKSTFKKLPDGKFLDEGVYNIYADYNLHLGWQFCDNPKCKLICENSRKNYMMEHKIFSTKDIFCKDKDEIVSFKIPRSKTDENGNNIIELWNLDFNYQSKWNYDIKDFIIPFVSQDMMLFKDIKLSDLKKYNDGDSNLEKIICYIESNF